MVMFDDDDGRPFETEEERFEEWENEVAELVEDRQRLLDALGLTEHEWACRGGKRFPPFERFEWGDDDDDDDYDLPDEIDVPAQPQPNVEVWTPPAKFDEVAAVTWADGVEPPPLPTPPPLPVASLTFGSPPPLPAPPPLPKPAWTEEQSGALSDIDEWMDGAEAFFSLTGPAGSGKSTLVREIVDRYPAAALAAMTGKAALRLSQCAGRGTTTLHSILYWPPRPGESLKFTRVREPTVEFLVVDESSMMTPSVFSDLKIWAQNGVKVLLVGDSFQLPPVITGDEFKKYGKDYSVFAHVSGAELRTVMRSVGGVLRAATKVRETGEIVRESDDGYEYVREVRPLQRAVEDYLADREGHLLITWRNQARMMANHAIRGRLGHEGPLPDVGEPVLIKRNIGGFLNGEIVECGGFEDGPTLGSLHCLWMKVRDTKILVSVEGGPRDKGGEFMDGQMPWVENWSKYHVELKKQDLPEPAPITFGYCLTAHSAQGSEGRRVTVFLERGDASNPHFREKTTLPSGETVTMAARWLYTALTRGKYRATMIVGR